jgi:glycosyltransferase involved in cell wall biosynthesis/GT2 family glycosyltransferase
VRGHVTLAVTYAGLLGGAERTLLDFSGALPGRVVLACPEGALADRARAVGITVFALRERPLELRDGIAGRVRANVQLAGHARELRGLVRELQPALVLAWGMRSTIAAPAALAGMDPRPALLVRQVDFLPSPLVGRLVRAAAGSADRVSVNSRAVALDLDPQGRLGARLSIVSPGVDTAAYEPSDWQVGPRPEALLLGAIVPWKRPDLALEAVALASREVPELRLTIVGAAMGAAGERLTAALERRARQPDLAGRVELAGEVGDPRAALAHAWCLLHCAEREPFGSVVVQALASGRPVVAPAAGGPAEIVDETCGRLYAPGDAEAAARALVDVLSEPGRARSLGSAGRVRARRFDAGEARRRFAQVAEEAVAARAEGAAARPDTPPGTGMALVTVTHNSQGVVAGLLRSARRHLPGATLIVVDSGSGDGSADAARRAAPDAIVVELGENVGFGRASNAGVARVEDPVCVLVNPDVELLDDSLAALADDLLRPGAPDRILAPAALSPDGSRQDTAQLDPACSLLALKALVPSALLPGALRVPLDPWRARQPRRIGWAVGCCLVARTDVLRRLGPFDDRIFLFAEDLDLGMRAAERGVETWFRPDARVLHLDAHSTSPTFGGEPFERLAEARRAVVGERRGRRAARRDHWIWLLTYADRIALKALTHRPTTRERRQLAAQWRAREAPSRLAARPGAR